MSAPGRRSMSRSMMPGRSRFSVTVPGRRRRHGTALEVRNPPGRNRTGAFTAPDPAVFVPVPVVITGDPDIVPVAVAVVGDDNRSRSHHHRPLNHHYRFLNHHHRGGSHHHRGRSHHHRPGRMMTVVRGSCLKGADSPQQCRNQRKLFDHDRFPCIYLPSFKVPNRSILWNPP